MDEKKKGPEYSGPFLKSLEHFIRLLFSNKKA